MAPPPALGAEIFGFGFRLRLTPEQAVTYYLPRLIAGMPLPDCVRPVIHHADVYACTPADLARRFCPLPSTFDRFFFTPSASSRKRPSAGAGRASRAGSWYATQKTVDIKRTGDAGAKIGKFKKLRYKMSGGAYTDWLMEEYSCCCGSDVAAGETQFVLCKMYVSPRAAPSSTAHKESAAYFSTLLSPPPPTASVAVAVATRPSPARAPAPKRPAPPQPAMSPACAKRMRPGPVLQRAGGNMPLPPPPPQASSCAPPVLPTRPPLAAVRKMALTPPQPSCAPRRVSTTPLATQPSPASAPSLAPPVPVRPAVQPHRSPLPLPTPPPQDPLRDEAEDQTVAAAPHPPPLPAPALQDGDGLVKGMEAAASSPLPLPSLEPPAELHDEDDWDKFTKELEDAMETSEAEPAARGSTMTDDEFDQFVSFLDDQITAADVTRHWLDAEAVARAQDLVFL